MYATDEVILNYLPPFLSLQIPAYSNTTISMSPSAFFVSTPLKYLQQSGNNITLLHMVPVNTPLKKPDFFNDFCLCMTLFTNRIDLEICDVSCIKNKVI